MLHKTKGIIFHTTDYGETSLVVKIYTELFGLQSYMINSVRKKKSKVRQNYFQPLTLVELVVYHKKGHGLQRISEIKPFPVLQSIPTDMIKTSIVFFLNEVLYRSIREEESNPELFTFLFHSIEILEHQSSSSEFHLLFLLQLSRYLGFFPTKNFSNERQIFNLQDGIFQSQIPNHPFYILPDHSSKFFRLLNSNYDSVNEELLPLNVKRELIDHLLDYYRLHIENFGEIRSKKVLEEIFQ